MKNTTQNAVVAGDGVSDARIAQADAAVAELATLEAEQAASAKALAQQLGYEGVMTVGVLEDGIRFYQRKTVEACLELGKRLLLLKELSNHGEFIGRVELLGFSRRSAHRFMQAAAQTAKCANLAHLSRQVKSASAFLELVTQDDEVLEDLKNLDDIDRMSASQLRAKMREIKAEQEADKQLLDKKNERIGELEQEAERAKAKSKLATPDEEYEELLLMAAEGTSGELNRVATVWRQVFNGLQAHDSQHGTDSRAIIGGYVQRMQQLCLELREQYHLQALNSEGKPAWQTADLSKLPDPRPDWMKKQQAEHAAAQAEAQSDGKA